MSYALNAITAPDQYNQVAVIEGVPIMRVIFDVVNQAIYWNLKSHVSGGQSGNWDATEVYMLPGSRVIVRHGIVGVRIRAAIPAASIPVGAHQAIVTVEAVTQ